MQIQMRLLVMSVSSGSTLLAILFLIFFLLKPLFATMDVSRLRDRRVCFRNSGERIKQIALKWLCHTRIEIKFKSGKYYYCHSVLDILLKPLFATMNVSKFRDGRVHFRNTGVERFNIALKWLCHTRIRFKSGTYCGKYIRPADIGHSFRLSRW